jgi:hypothetical protein
VSSQRFLSASMIFRRSSWTHIGTSIIHIKVAHASGFSSSSALGCSVSWDDPKQIRSSTSKNGQNSNGTGQHARGFRTTIIPES